MKKHVPEIRSKDLSEMEFFAKELWAVIPNKTYQVHVEKCRNKLLVLFDHKEVIESIKCIT